ncbi:MAG: acyltransferase [Deltaproteobacteria bacterium]|nr:acyltransferase [Deltaproteobacteria bacterium]
MRRNLGIDLLRGLSILYIVGFWHLLNYTRVIHNYNNIITYRITWIVLATFVLISGYFLGGKYINQHTLFAFYKKRLKRIYPPYFIAIFVFTILGLSDKITSIKAILSISMFIRPAPRTLWFITMLLFFYLMSPLFISLSRQCVIQYLLLYTSLLCILLGYEYASNWLFNYYYLDIRVAVYLAPFMTGVYISNNDIAKNKTKFILFGAIIAFSISCYFNSDNYGMNLLYSIPMVTIVPLLLFLFFSQLTIESLNAQRIIIFLSTASYFMYLFHRPFYIAIKKVYFPSSPIPQLLFLFIICLPVIIVASFVMQKIYDNMLK